MSKLKIFTFPNGLMFKKIFQTFPSGFKNFYFELGDSYIRIYAKSKYEVLSLNIPLSSSIEKQLFKLNRGYFENYIKKFELDDEVNLSFDTDKKKLSIESEDKRLILGTKEISESKLEQSKYIISMFDGVINWEIEADQALFYQVLNRAYNAFSLNYDITFIVAEDKFIISTSREIFRIFGGYNLNIGNDNLEWYFPSSHQHDSIISILELSKLLLTDTITIKSNLQHLLEISFPFLNEGTLKYVQTGSSYDLEEFKSQKDSTRNTIFSYSKTIPSVVFQEIVEKTGGIPPDMVLSVILEMIDKGDIDQHFISNLPIYDIMQTEFDEKNIIDIDSTEMAEDFPENIVIFISYATKDTDRFQIKEIANTLTKFEEIKSVLYWQEDMHDNIFEYMNENLAKCDLMLLFCSQFALQSVPVRKEWTAADAINIPIIPVFVNVDDIPPLLRSRLGIQLEPKDFKKNILSLHSLILKKLSKKSVPVSYSNVHKLSKNHSKIKQTFGLTPDKEKEREEEYERMASIIKELLIQYGKLSTENVFENLESYYNIDYINNEFVTKGLVESFLTEFGFKDPHSNFYWYNRDHYESSRDIVKFRRYEIYRYEKEVIEEWEELIKEKDEIEFSVDNNHIISISIRGVNLYNFPQSLQMLQYLESISLTRNFMNSITAENLTNLIKKAPVKRLDFSYNRDINYIPIIPSLKEIYLNETTVSSLPKTINEMPNLEKLEIIHRSSGNYGIEHIDEAVAERVFRANLSPDFGVLYLQGLEDPSKQLKIDFNIDRYYFDKIRDRFSHLTGDHVPSKEKQKELFDIFSKK